MKYSQSFLTLNPLSANPEKWSNTLKQIVGNLPTTCLIVVDHFINLALKGLNVTKQFLCQPGILSVHLAEFSYHPRLVSLMPPRCKNYYGSHPGKFLKILHFPR